MAKLLFTVATLLTCLATARCTNSKFVKTVPTITNSLVNLGKMEISFYFNGKHQDNPSNPVNIPSLPSVPITRSHIMEAPCPCSAFKSSKDSFLPDPSDIISKILRSNDLFKDPTSAHCCDSHEQIEEKTVYFELGPNRPPMTINNLRNPMNSMKFPPSYQKVFDSPSGMFPMRPKAMEIFLFPKRKDIGSMDSFKMATKPVSKPDIQVVGDKEIKPLNEGASVKKDLASLSDKNETDNELKVETTVTNINNAL